MLQYILSFIVLISIVVFIHEYGHYYFAKKYKVGVTDFSIGFGKELFGFNDKDGTRWKICAIPLGGYVKFFGDSNSASQPTSLSKINEDDHSKLLTTKPLYQRAIIESAGPIANLILAIITIFILLFLIKIIFQLFYYWYESKFIYNFKQEITHTLFYIYLNQNFNFFFKRNSSEFIRNVTLAVDHIITYYLYLLKLFLEIFVIIAILIILFYINFIESWN